MCHRMYKNEFYLLYDHKCPAKNGLQRSGTGQLLDELAGIERTAGFISGDVNVATIGNLTS